MFIFACGLDPFFHKGIVSELPRHLGCGSSKDFRDHAAKDKRGMPYYSRVVSVLLDDREVNELLPRLCVRQGASVRANFLSMKPRPCTAFSMDAMD